MNTKWLTARYAVLQIAYWGAYCALSGYAAVFLTGKGFSAGQTGTLMALGNVLAALLQPVAAAAADRGKHVSLKGLMLSIGGFSTVMLLALGLSGKQFLAICLGFAAATVSIQVIQPLLNAMGMYFVGRGEHLNFGLARGLGSVGYAAVSYLMGVLTEVLGENVIPLIAFFLCIPFLAVTLSFRMGGNAGSAGAGKQEPQRAESRPSPENIFLFLRRRGAFAVLLLGVICFFTFHFMTNTYMFQMIEAVGGDSQDMGLAVSLAAMTEIPVMALFAWLVKKIRVERLLRFSAVMWIVRSVFFCLCTSVVSIYGAQLMQMITYGLYIPASVYYADQVMDPDHKVQGQALMTMAFTVGSVFGNFLGGILIDRFSVHTMLCFGAFCTTAGTLCFFAGTRRKTIDEQETVC